jgi:hypothetical protein
VKVGVGAEVLESGECLFGTGQEWAERRGNNAKMREGSAQVREEASGRKGRRVKEEK